jgi:hypothetical protein
MQSIAPPVSSDVNKFTLQRNGSPMNILEVMEALRAGDSEVADLLSHIIVQEAATRGWNAVFWECKLSNPSSLSQTFEFVVLNAASLATVRPDPHTFAQHFQQSGNHNKDVIVFPNLSRDAYLVVPRPIGEDSFPHLLSFLRTANASQRRSLWHTVGRTYLELIQSSSAPLWLSTSGLGVYWLHVRLDRVPKYYNFLEYKLCNP